MSTSTSTSSLSSLSPPADAVSVPPSPPSHTSSPPTTILGTPPESEPFFPSPAVRRRVPSVLMRAGTSKGLFFRRQDLPDDRALWGPILLGAMGSPDATGRQLNGMGAGTSTTSKVAVVGRSAHPDADVDYTFVQVPIDGGAVDFSGNCGNMASGVGPFAVDEGLVKVPGHAGQVTVRIRKFINATFAVDDFGQPVEDGSFRIAGVAAPAAPIRLDFLYPGGAMTGSLLPTGHAAEDITVDVRPAPRPLPSPGSEQPPSPTRVTVRVSCVDAANPFVFVRASDLGVRGDESQTAIAAYTDVLMRIREAAAVRMGLAPNVDAARLVAGTPKVALVGAPAAYDAIDGSHSDTMDVWVRPFSMGAPHPAIQMTGAVCVAAAAAVRGTVVQEIVEESRRRSGRAGLGSEIVIGHASGTITVSSQTEVKGGEVVIRSGNVYRTARRLMEGNVLYLDHSGDKSMAE